MCKYEMCDIVVVDCFVGSDVVWVEIVGEVGYGGGVGIGIGYY